MANSVQIRVNGRTVTITVGGSGGNRSSGAAGGAGELSDTAGTGEVSDTGSGTGTGMSSACCCTTVIGPIVISGSGMGAASSDSGGAGELSDTGGAGELSDTGGSGELSDTGGGSSGSVSCGCGPTVIGPIVIDGCCSSAGSSQPATVTGPRPIGPRKLRSPGPWPQGPTSENPFSMQTQMEDQWCWNAVAVSINDFLDPADPPTWTQITLAAKLLPWQCGLPGSDDPCDRAWSLDSALTATGNLDKACFNSIMKFADLQAYWANCSFPLGARIVWFNEGGMAHFIALSGAAVFSSGLQLVTVNDPSPSNYGPALWDYDVLRSYYQCPPDPQNPSAVRPRGFWNDTYFVKP